MSNPPDLTAPAQTPRQELANWLLHGLGLVLSTAGAAVAITFAGIYGNLWHIVGVSIYGATLVILYGSSTLYHAARSEVAKRRLRIADHIGIFLLIAGTYTPFTFVTLQGGWGWSIFGVQWGLALVGICFKLFFVGRFQLMSTLAYLGMGWMIVVAIYPLYQALAHWGLFWLVAGGLAYSLGTLFFHKEEYGYNHAIWHGFVMVGSVCHFMAIFFFVIPEVTQ
ncbi:MAG: hemolysin III family protein [bacterium]|nr:hemolysin III family protein [bacterium]